MHCLSAAALNSCEVLNSHPSLLHHTGTLMQHGLKQQDRISMNFAYIVIKNKILTGGVVVLVFRSLLSHDTFWLNLGSLV